MIEQFMLGVFGITAVWCSQSPHHSVRRWACIAGLIAQPFWFYATWKANQWGIFLLSFVYTAGWMRGLHTYWWRQPAITNRVGEPIWPPVNSKERTCSKPTAKRS